jgi:hypothetical protein
MTKKKLESVDDSSSDIDSEKKSRTRPNFTRFFLSSTKKDHRESPMVRIEHQDKDDYVLVGDEIQEFLLDEISIDISIDEESQSQQTQNLDRTFDLIEEYKRILGVKQLFEWQSE